MVPNPLRHRGNAKGVPLQPSKERHTCARIQFTLPGSPHTHIHTQTPCLASRHIGGCFFPFSIITSIVRGASALPPAEVPGILQLPYCTAWIQAADSWMVGRPTERGLQEAD